MSNANLPLLFDEKFRDRIEWFYGERSHEDLTSTLDLTIKMMLKEYEKCLERKDEGRWYFRLAQAADEVRALAAGITLNLQREEEMARKCMEIFTGEKED